jgi:hypothetical protein
MPLRISYKSNDRPELLFKHQLLVEAGHAFALRKSKDIGGFVVAVCLKPDIGAEVYMADESYEEDGKKDDGQTNISWNEHDPHAIILPGHFVEVDFIDTDDESMRLTLQHVMPNGYVNSLN